VNQYSTVRAATLTYDGNGNLTGDGVDTFAYDTQNHLLAASALGNTIAYAYDPLGRRASKTVNGTVTAYVDAGDRAGQLKAQMRAMSSSTRADDVSGFTLIELLVVLVILGMIVAFVTPQVLHYLSRAKSDSAHIQIENIAGALDLYRLDVGRYPT
jgi:prepilin-type N-terminal cleavage/methylation domain-containing protein